jgi:hypothetical protein
MLKWQKNVKGINIVNKKGREVAASRPLRK